MDINPNAIGEPTNLEELEEKVEEHIDTEQVEVVDPQQATVSDYILGNTRLEGELYCDYKCRLYWEKILSKRYHAGRQIWNSRQQGEIRNTEKITGERKLSKSRIKKDNQKERVRKIREAQGVLTPDEVKCLNRKRKKAFLRACEQ
jgi:hypothetical protein